MKAKPLLSLFFLFTFLMNCSHEVEQIELKGIIPQPNSLIKAEGYFRMGRGIGMEFGEEFKESGAFLSEFLESAGISLMEGTDMVFVKDDALKTEAYELEINPNQIQIRAGSDQGAFYAVQSLRQILPPRF
jgi:hexosaminidase